MRSEGFQRFLPKKLTIARGPVGVKVAVCGHSVGTGLERILLCTSLIFVVASYQRGTP